MLGRKICLCSIIIVLTGVTPMLSMAQNTADDWLMQVATTAKSHSFTGEVVHGVDGEMMHYQVSYQAMPDSPVQSISAIDPHARAIVLGEHEVACYLPDKQMGVREGRKVLQPFLLDSDLDSFHTHYTAQLLEQSTVASRPCQALEIIPKDNYRFGYYWCVDTQTYLPLKSELRHYHGDRHTVLESQMFVTIDYIAPQLAKAGGEGAHDLHWQHEHVTHELDESGGGLGLSLSNTHGFRLLYRLKRDSAVLNKIIQHLVYSDGLARVSIFLLPVEKGSEVAQYHHQMGAISAVAKQGKNHKVMIMGEVPMRLAESFAAQIH